MLEMFADYKRASLLGPFVSYEENAALQIRHLVPVAGAAVGHLLNRVDVRRDELRRSVGFAAVDARLLWSGRQFVDQRFPDFLRQRFLGFRSRVMVRKGRLLHQNFFPLSSLTF